MHQGLVLRCLCGEGRKRTVHRRNTRAITGSQMAHPNENPWRTGGIPIEVMQYIPAGMQEPPGTYETVGSQSLVSTVGGRNKKGKLPDAETPVQVRCASSRHNDRIEVAPIRLFEQRTQRDVNECDENRSDTFMKSTSSSLQRNLHSEWLCTAIRILIDRNDIWKRGTSPAPTGVRCWCSPLPDYRVRTADRVCTGGQGV